MLIKLKLGSSLAALILFALPWLDIQCSEKSMATQSGLEVIYGGASVSDEKESKKNQDRNSDDSLGFAPLVAISLVAVIGAVVFAFISLFRGGARADILSSTLPAIALILLLVQAMIGFPVKQKITDSMSAPPSKTQSGIDGFGSAMDDSIAAAMMMNISLKTTPVFYFVLLALAIPTLILLNSLIDKFKKEEH